MVKVPVWIIENLGGLVLLSQPYDDGVSLWPTGTVGKLISIQSGDGHPHATVEIVNHISGAEENIEFGCLRPVVIGYTDNRAISR